MPVLKCELNEKFLSSLLFRNINLILRYLETISFATCGEWRMGDIWKQFHSPHVASGEWFGQAAL
jgi:hypothetical protein